MVISFRKALFLFLIMVYMYARWMFAHMSADTWGGQKRASRSLELRLLAFVNCPVWMLGTEFGFSERAAVL